MEAVDTIVCAGGLDTLCDLFCVTPRKCFRMSTGISHQRLDGSMLNYLRRFFLGGSTLRILSAETLTVLPSLVLTFTA